MVTKEQINRINELAHKSKSVGLTAEEREEQKFLRRAYIDSFKENLRAQLDRIEIVDAPVKAGRGTGAAAETVETVETVETADAVETAETVEEVEVETLS